jgi:hypothetical protein
MCQKCADEMERFLKEDPLPISDVCLCAPDFVMMFRVKDDLRWVVGRRICDLTASVDAEDDAYEYLAGNYDRWAIHCQHCGMVYAEGTTT